MAKTFGGLAISDVLAMTKEARCPTCTSNSRVKHPAIGFEGEVQPCRDIWHVAPGLIYEISELRSKLAEFRGVANCD